MNDFVHSLKKLKLKYWTLPCPERFKFGAGDPVVCKTAYFIPVFIHGASAIMRVFVVPGKFHSHWKLMQSVFFVLGINKLLMWIELMTLSSPLSR